MAVMVMPQRHKDIGTPPGDFKPLKVLARRSGTQNGLRTGRHHRKI